MESCMALEDLLHPYLGKYLGAPGWLKASAGRAYSMLPARVRLGGAYERFRSEVCSDTNAHDVEARLGAALEWALDTVPAYEGYRHVLAGSRSAREALSHLPVTDKLDIKRHPERYLSTAMPEHARLEMYTGGSTRNPMRFFLQKHVTRAKEYAFIQDFRARIGVGPHDTVLALRGRTVPSAAQPGGRLWMHEPIKRVLMAASTPDDDRYFFWPRYGHFELLDAENRPITQPGKLGFIVGTSYDNQVMPFVRYRTGDLGVLSERGHAQLAGFPTCERIVGRLQGFIVCPDRRLVSITTLGLAHF